MGILLFILKIIGIIILIPVIGALILFILPISYQAEVDFDGETPRCKAKVSWAFIFFRMSVVYDQQLDVVARIFGVPLYHSDSDKWSILGNDGKDPVKEDIIYEKETKSEEKEQPVKKISFPEPVAEEPIIKEIVKEEKKEGPIDDIFDLEWDMEEEETETPLKDTVEEKQSFFKRIVDFLKRCYNKCKCVAEKFRDFFEKAEDLKDLLEDEEICAAMSRIKGYGFQGVRYVLPQKIKGQITFGFEDPAVTGRLLGYLGMVYSIYGNHFQITPDFTGSIFHGYVFVFGRIRRYRIIRLLWKVYRDKELMKQKDRVLEIIGG